MCHGLTAEFPTYLFVRSCVLKDIHVWQMVHEEEELYSVQTMAELLFGNTEATSCYASHYLLNQERIFFKQASRSPPLFQARSPKDVNALRMQRDAEEQVYSLMSCRVIVSHDSLQLHAVLLHVVCVGICLAL